SKRYSDEEMLEMLRELMKRHGLISGVMIDEREDMPSSSAFWYRFGSLVRAYELVGYDPDINYGYIEVNRYLRKKHPEIVHEVISRLAALGVQVKQNTENDLLVLDDELIVSLVLSRCLLTPAGSTRWLVRLENAYRPDVTIVAR